MKSTTKLIQEREKIENELNIRTIELVKNSPSYKIKKKILIVSLIFLTASIVIFLLSAVMLLTKPDIKITEITELKPTTIVEKVIKNEYIIKGEKQMTCLNEVGKRKIDCYKEKL